MLIFNKTCAARTSVSTSMASKRKNVEPVYVLISCRRNGRTCPIDNQELSESEVRIKYLKITPVHVWLPVYPKIVLKICAFYVKSVKFEHVQETPVV